MSSGDFITIDVSASNRALDHGSLDERMLAVPPRQELRLRPLETSRLLLTPIDTSDARDLWAAVEASRAHLEPWLPWVPFNVDAEASFRYAEASAADWDNARACRLAI